MEDRAPRARRSCAFLLTQVGSHAAQRFGERLAALDLTPPLAGILGVLAGEAGLSQQALASLLSILPSRLVLLVDDLERRGLLERRDSKDDRRVYALHLTEKGRRTLDAIGRIATEHDAAICAPLTAKERESLAALLGKIAEAEGLAPGVHPGFRRLGRPPPKRR